MFQSVTVNNLCRACATIVEGNHQEEASKQFQKFRHLYSMLTELKVYDDDDLPKLICPTCVGLLETIESFKETCARTVDSIRKLIIANLKEEPMLEIVSAEALEPILKVENGSRGIKKNQPVLTRALKGSRPMCDLCGKIFVNMKGIRKHMNLELKYRLVPKVPSNIGRAVSRKIFCPQTDCGQNFNKRDNLEKHMKMHEDSKLSTYCSVCERTFISIGRYRRHMEVYHKAIGTPNHVCPTCHGTFKTVYILKAHILKKHIEEITTFDCATCGVRYVSELELKMHKIRRHQSGQNFNFICHFCEEVHNSKKAVREHIFKNHVTPVYEPCSICNVQVLPSRMVHHLRHVHFVRSDMPIFKCKICDKDFKQNSTLKKHLRIHTGERPYVCHVCGLAFLRRYSLKGHLYVHSGERPVHCDICGKGLYSRTALNIHMNIHKREWIAQGQTGIELTVYATSNKSKKKH